MFGYLLWLFGQQENPDEALVRRYRRDVRRRRQMKRLERERKEADSVAMELPGNEERRVGWVRKKGSVLATRVTYFINNGFLNKPP